MCGPSSPGGSRVASPTSMSTRSGNRVRDPVMASWTSLGGSMAPQTQTSSLPGAFNSQPASRPTVVSSSGGSTTGSSSAPTDPFIREDERGFRSAGGDRRRRSQSIFARTTSAATRTALGQA